MSPEKTGFPGAAIVNVVIVAEAVGAKNSIGVILPCLILCDIIVYPVFRKYASWKPVWPLMVPAIAGVVLSYFLLQQIDNQAAKRIIGAIILVMLALQLLRKYKEKFLRRLPDSKTFFIGTGLGIGVSTMLANAAGPVYAIYALVHKMSKQDFLGIGARFFLFINIFKVPFGSGLGIINGESLLLDLMLVPGLLAGILLGKMLIEKVPQRVFEFLLYAFSLIAGIRMIW